MAVRERWIYPSDGSPPYRVDADARQAPRTEGSPSIAMNLGLFNRMEKRGKVPVSEHKNVQKDWKRGQEYKRQAEKRQRLKDVVDVVKGYGG
jgi:hypothetical protein